MWSDGHDEVFYVCPRRFVTEDIIEWYQEYLYNKEMMGSAIKYQDQSSKYIDAWMYYKSYFDRYEAEESQIRANRLQEKYSRRE